MLSPCQPRWLRNSRVRCTVAASKIWRGGPCEICQASGNDVVITLRETLARHVLIVFGREIRSEQDAAGMGPQHRRVRDMLLTADLPALEAEIERHITRLRNRRKAGGARREEQA